MDETAINWDSIPDIITKDQLYQICHISKSTGFVSASQRQDTVRIHGKKTRCYKIKKADVITYLEKRKVFPNPIQHRLGGTRGTIPSK